MSAPAGGTIRRGKQDRSLRLSDVVVRNMAARTFRTAAVLMAIAVIVSLLFSTVVLSVGAGRSAELASERLGADMIVLPPILDVVQSYGYASETLNRAPATLSYIDGSTAGRIANISGIARVSPQLYVGAVSPRPGGTPVDLIAFDQATDFTVLPWMGGQSKLQLADDDAVAGYKTGLAAGDTVDWNGHLLNVVAVLEESDTSLDTAVFFPLRGAYAALNDGGSTSSPGANQISALLVRLDASHLPELVGRQVAERIVPSKVVVARDIERQVGALIGGLTTFQLVQEGVVGAGFFVVVGFLFSMSANERKRQLGLFRALGGSRRVVALAVIIEACLTAAVGTILGLVAGSSLAYLGTASIIHVFGLPSLQPTLFDILPLVAGFGVLGVGLGTGAALYPAYLASRLEPYEAIRQGD